MENKKEAGKVKKFMKEHGKDILIGIAGGAIFVSGVIVGRKVAHNKFIKILKSSEVIDFMCDCAEIGCDNRFYKGTFEPGKYTLSNLGEIGIEAVKEAEQVGITDITGNTGVVGVLVSINKTNN